MSTKLFEIRVKRGVSRQRVSRDTGIPYSTLERLEKGIGDRVNLVHLRKLAEYYGAEFNVKEMLK